MWFYSPLSARNQGALSCGSSSPSQHGLKWPYDVNVIPPLNSHSKSLQCESNSPSQLALKGPCNVDVIPPLNSYLKGPAMWM